jgi:hypothetical protein
MFGRIREFDAADGLGWIDLDDGRAARFGLTACVAFVPAPGMRVDADQLEERRDVLRAAVVRPKLDEVDVEEHVWPTPLHEQAQERRRVDDVERSVSVRYRAFDRDAAYARTPAWPPANAFIGRAYTPADKGPPPTPHPFFAPWHDGIVASSVGMLALTLAHDGTAGRFGGGFAMLARGWPECATHGRMALIISVEPTTMASIVGVARRLTLHVCIDCLNRDEIAWAGSPGGPVSVEWSDGGTLKSPPRVPTFQSIRLTAKPALSFPPAWLFYPRRDVQGHYPIVGVPAGLLEVPLRLDRATESSTYEEARFAYDRHYTSDDGDVVIGGFSSHGFGLCRTCVSPLRQILCICDYLSVDGLAAAFHGNRRLRLLACDRTPDCGGPEHGFVISEL